VGTGERIRHIIEKNLKNRNNFDIVSNPEFLREGAAIEDFMRPNRVVLGARSQEAVAILKDLYKPLYLLETPFVITNIETAELIKYASNSFLATKISFINEMANLCERVGADVQMVAKAMGLDQRIGSKFLHAGPGFGGSCFPKDTKALLRIGQQHGAELNIVRAAVLANEHQKKVAFEKMKTAMGSLRGKTIALLGLSFKPNTDDLREAPSISLVEDLLKSRAKVRAYDPVAIENAKTIFPGITYCKGPYEAVKSADALVIMTEWNQFRNLDLERIKGVLSQPFFFDLRNIYEPEKMRRLGFKYFSVGRAG